MAEIGGGPAINKTLQAMIEVGKDTKMELAAERVSARKSIREALSETTTQLGDKVKKKERKPKTEQLKRVLQAMKSGEKAASSEQSKNIERRAEDYQRRNPELKAKSLNQLREYIKPGDTKEEILKKIQDFYSDVTLQDEALEFLEETTDGELYQQVRDCKDELNKEHKREISAGRNISEQARAAEGLGSPTSLRDMYRDITGNPRDSNQLFKELSDKYSFKELTKVVSFLLHSMGADMKAKGPSIPRGQLHRLLTETRSLQAILGVYRFFNGRMGLMHKLFEKDGLTFPQRLNFELMAKAFMELAADRYPTGDKVLNLATKLGIEKWILAKIIVFSQMRDAIRQVAMQQVYKSLQHRDELFLAILEALEDLEDQWEEEESEGEDSDEDEWEGDIIEEKKEE